MTPKPMTPTEVIARWASLPLAKRAGILESLPEKQQEVLEPFMEALADGHTPNLAEIGRQLGIDRSRVRRRLDVALKKISGKLS